MPCGPKIGETYKYIQTHIFIYNISVTVAIFRIEFLGEQVPLGITRGKKKIDNGMEKFQIAINLISFTFIYNLILEPDTIVT